MMEAPTTTPQALLSLLRGQHWLYYTLHWQSSGPDFYEQHLLFERLYGALPEQFDALAEKLVNQVGPEAVDAVATIEAATESLRAWLGNADPVAAAIASEEAVQACIDALIAEPLSCGLDNLLRTIADQHDTHLYLLEQIVGPEAKNTAPPTAAAAIAKPVAPAVHTTVTPVRLPLTIMDRSIWAIHPAMMQRLVDCVRRQPEAMAAVSDGGAATQKQGNIAVVPIRGPLSQRMDMLTWFMGGTSMENLGKTIDALVADTSIESILLDFDSPGGTYAGTPELAGKIKAAAGQKRVWAIANGMAASAAYWLASAADRVFATPSGEVGSIGVVAVHYDVSAANEKWGVKPTYVTYGDYKAEFNHDSPLSTEARSELQRRVDEAGENFVKAVASQRGASQTTVRESYGKGRVFSAADALERGMIDGIDTIEGVLARMGNRKAGAGKRAAAERARLELEKYR